MADKLTKELRDWLDYLQKRLEELMASPQIAFDADCRSALPAAPGIYRIFDPADPMNTIRAGRTRAPGGLQQRLYQNHLMGKQPGNLRHQLVEHGVCADLDAAKAHMRNKLVAQVLVVSNAREIAWLEHFMLAVLRPCYSD
jgi:hypothetical protein